MDHVELVGFTLKDGSHLIIPKAAIRNLNDKGAPSGTWLTYATETGQTSALVDSSIAQITSVLGVVTVPVIEL